MARSPRSANLPHGSSAEDIRKALASLNRQSGRSTSKDARVELLEALRLCAVAPVPDVEYLFHPTRKWKFDLAWPELKIAVEIEGLVYSNRGDNQLTGRHASVTGFKNDIEKYGTAFSLGWNVLRITSADARNGTALNWIEAHLKAIDARR